MTGKGSASTKRSDPAGPIRTCIGCRVRRPADELVRTVRTREGSVRIGRTLAGRGAWLCPDIACVEAAARRGAFARAFRRPVDGTEIDALQDRWSDLLRSPDSGVPG